MKQTFNPLTSKRTYFIQGDQKVSVNLMVTIQKSGAQDYLITCANHQGRTAK